MTITAASCDNGDKLIISVQGRFDFSSLQMFRQAYEQPDLKPNSYVVDLKESDYLDSSALGMLLALRDYAGGDNATVKIINCNPDIRKIMTITKLDELFTIE